MPPEEVREKFKRVKPLKDISVTQRGWTLDVLNVVRRLVSEGRAPRAPNISNQSGTRLGTRGTRPSDFSGLPGLHTEMVVRRFYLHY